MKRLIASIVAIATLMTLATEETPAQAGNATSQPQDESNPIFGHMTSEEVKKLTPEQREQRKAHFQAKIYKYTGGNIIKPGSQKGRVVYINAQSRAEECWLQESADFFMDKTRLAVAIEKGEFSFPTPELKGELNIFIVDDPSLPSLLGAPENRWAMVNVAPLFTEKRKFFEARVKKELTRAFVLVAGGIDSSYPGNCTGPVVEAKDLDKFMDYFLPVDVLARFEKAVAKAGLKPSYQATYRKACSDGWAPPPTNDVQKAIWEEIRALPAKPIKIEYDPAKGK